MKIKVLVPPQKSAISLEQVKDYLKIDTSDEDCLLSDLIQAATQQVESLTSRALMTQDWRVTLSNRDFTKGITHLPGGDLQTVLKKPQLIKSDKAYPLTDFTLDCAAIPARLIRHIPLNDGEVVQMDIRLGCGDHPSDVPAGLRQALVLLVAHYYQSRGDSASSMCPTARSFIDRFRVYTMK